MSDTTTASVFGIVLPASSPALVLPAQAATPSLWPRAVLFAGLALVHLASGSAILALLAWAYTIKRRLGIDVVPGVDMLPDPEIEAAIRAVVSWLGWLGW